MKKTYMTPVIDIENFEIDIDILRGMTQADLDFARIDFEMTFADDIAGMTDEQIEASKARLERGRQKRLSMIGDDAHVGLERSRKDEQ